MSFRSDILSFSAKVRRMFGFKMVCSELPLAKGLIGCDIGVFLDSISFSVSMVPNALWLACDPFSPVPREFLVPSEGSPDLPESALLLRSDTVRLVFSLLDLSRIIRF